MYQVDQEFKFCSLLVKCMRQNNDHYFGRSIKQRLTHLQKFTLYHVAVESNAYSASVA